MRVVEKRRFAEERACRIKAQMEKMRSAGARHVAGIMPAENNHRERHLEDMCFAENDRSKGHLRWLQIDF